MNQWKIVSQKNIFKAELFDVWEIDFQNKEGKKKIHHIVERTPTVSVFPINYNYEIYLISQYRYMLKKTALEAVAGYMKEDEAEIETAKRELKEETGITATKWEQIGKVEMGASVFRGQNHLFLARELLLQEPMLEDDEKISLVKMPLSEAVRKVISGEINHSASMIGILLLGELKKQEKL